jgi:hypothetical protein
MGARTNTHGSGTEGREILKQWHRRDDNFFRGKSRISITFRTQKGLSLFFIHAATGDAMFTALRSQ